MIIEYTILVDISSSKEELSFDFDLEEIEEDGVYPLIDCAIENHINDFYCCCTFSESQNHCDCDNDYNGYEITDRKEIK